MKCVCKDNGKFACVGVGEVDEVHIIFVRYKTHAVPYNCNDVDEIGFSNGLYALRTKKSNDRAIKILEVWL